MAHETAVSADILRTHCGPAAAKSSLLSGPHWDIDELRSSLEADWRRTLDRYSLSPLTETMTYALSGGQRLRGLLLMVVADSCNGSKEPAREAAVAIEMLHAASLVVDDLPALDNTPVRRGMLSLYKRFGEAAAILTAHALVAAAFEVVAQISIEPKRLLRITKSLAAAIGARGMARAELVDCSDSVGSEGDIRALKTGGLFQIAAHIGAVLAGAEPDLANDLGTLGRKLGVCYQFADDVRDHLADGSNRETLKEAGRVSWQQSVKLFNLVRNRLPKVYPLEAWLSCFHHAGAEIFDAAEFRSRYEPPPAFADTKTLDKDGQP
ncbi:MAG TPA: polyprenyl synthetase family protein [Terracidiphilus sp.]|nr:polyprenyl synthetase family protein [Terracidiphilus sp.]